MKLILALMIFGSAGVRLAFCQTHDPFFLGAASWSDNGNKIVIMPHMKELRVHDLLGKQLISILSKHNISEFSLSPDGAWLAYAVEGEGIWTQNLVDNTQKFQICVEDKMRMDICRGVQWSPDSGHVGYFKIKFSGDKPFKAVASVTFQLSPPDGKNIKVVSSWP